jgi:4-hydroxy-3-methylbut-2-enyl diphosphate reductase
MHILNHLTGRAESKYNDPERERFYSQYRSPLIAMALISGAFGLVLAYEMGALPFWVLLSMSLLGLSYNMRLVPLPMDGRIALRSIREIPGSKTILIALAWGTVTALLPALARAEGNWIAGTAAFVWAAGIVFCRTAFFDILGMQGDRIVGKETLPIVIGPKRTFTLLMSLLGALIVLLPISAAFGTTSRLAYFMILPPLLLFGIIRGYRRGNLLPGTHLEFRVESLFVLCGLLAFICNSVLEICGI